MKLFIHYLHKKKLDAANEKKERDLTVYYSFNSPKPSQDNNDGMARNTNCISLMPLKNTQVFVREFIYFRFETKKGCRANLKAIFPKQDNLEKKLKSNDNIKPLTQQ